jgi:hypothetical protein
MEKAGEEPARISAANRLVAEGEVDPLYSNTLSQSVNQYCE